MDGNLVNLVGFGFVESAAWCQQRLLSQQDLGPAATNFSHKKTLLAGCHQGWFFCEY
jgi:hypothetical protein